MPQLNYIPVHFTFFLILGIILGYAIDFPIWISFVAIIILFLGLVLTFLKAEKSFKFPVEFLGFTSMLFFIIGIISIQLSKPENQKNHYSHFLRDSNNSILRIHKILKPNDYFFKMEAEVLQLDNKKTCGKVLLQLET